jgi:outer membrane protein assembly factor BamA
MKYGACATGYAGWRRLLFWLLCVAVSLPVQAQEAAEDAAEDAPADVPAVSAPAGIITAIEFAGNRVTKPKILRYEIMIKEGDVADPVLIESSRQAIMDLGLFTSVAASVEPREDGNVVRFTVKEKYYILPVPKLDRDDDNNFSIGAEISIDNLAGLNQQLKLRYENENADGLSGGKIGTTTFSYTYPRVNGSPYLIYTEINQTHLPAEVVTGATVSSLYELEAWSASLQVSRWLVPRGPSRGWQAGTGLVWRRNGYDYVSGAPTDKFLDGQAVGLSVFGQFIDVRDYLFSRRGKEYGYRGEFGAPALGSDTQYRRHELFYRRYLRLESVPHENLEFQGRLGLSSGDIFADQDYAYALGGSKTLRAYDTLSFTGNSFILFNLQYLRPLFGYAPFRGVLFLDIGNVYRSNETINLGDLKWDVGFGVRLRLKSFVKLDLRVDVAYAYDTGEYKVFAGSKEVF